MIKAKKGLLIALFAAMMVFAFGATSVFASTVDADKVITPATITNVDWTNPAAAVVDVENASKTQSAQYVFELMTEEQANNLPTPTKEQYVFYLRDTGNETLDGHIKVKARDLYYKHSSQRGPSSWRWGNEHKVADLNWTVADTTVVMSKTVIDMANQDVYAKASAQTPMGDSLSVDAGDYSAWLILKDLEEGDVDFSYKAAAVNAAKNWDIASVFTNDATDKNYAALWSAEYGAYDAYSYDVDGTVKANKKTTITIKPNVAAIEAYVGKMNLKDVIILDTPKTIELTCAVIDFDHSVGSKAYWTAWAEKNATWTYDGTAHPVAFTHIPAAVTVNYAVFKENAKLADGTKVTATTKAEDLADADWAASAEIKDAGKYFVFVKMTLEKNPVKVFYDKGVTNVAKFPVALGFTQRQLRAEYGKYTKDSLEAAVKDMVVFQNNTPDSQDKIAEVVSKYCLVGGLFTDAGIGDLVAKIDTAALEKDTALFDAVANYDIEPGYDKYHGVPNAALELVIEKVSNRVDFESVTKTYHVKKAKKLKKAKKFQLEASALYGDVKFAKTSGSTKVKVSKTGKVTVKKGTKKGTYKVKVKAYVNGTANYGAAAQTVAIYVKVKK